MKDSKDLCLDATSERYSKVVQAFRDISPELSSPLEKKQELCVFHPMHLWQGIQRMNQQFHKREDRKTCKGWKNIFKNSGKVERNSEINYGCSYMVVKGVIKSCERLLLSLEKNARG